MADNVTLVGGQVIASDDIGGVQHQRLKMGWGVDGSYVDASATNPLPITVANASIAVTAASLPLPTGASTAAKQPALGTAGTASTDVLTVQGVASMTPLAVSASSLPLPTGAATQATLAALEAKVTAVNTGAVVISSALPAGTNLIGAALARDVTGIMADSAGVALTPLFKAISSSSSGNNEVVAAVASKKIRVLRCRVSGSAAVNFKFRSASTDITGLGYIAAAGGGVGWGYCPAGIFETGVNEPLNINLSDAVGVGGDLTYVLV